MTRTNGVSAKNTGLDVASTAIGIVVALQLFTGSAHGQSQSASDRLYPTRPVRLIVTSQPGSSPDVLARILAQHLSRGLGQQVVVDNRAGAGGVIGYEIASSSQPDGHTIVMSTIALVTTSTVNNKLPYHPVNSFTPIARVASVPYTLVVSPRLPAKSVKELIDLARSQPGKLNYGTPGVGTAQHLMTELLKQQARINLVHIPYKGGSAAVAAIIAGEAHMFFAGLPAAITQIKADRVRALAVTTPRRFPTVPEVPTMLEAGSPGFEVDQWHAIIGPANIPRARVEKLNLLIIRTLEMPDIKKTMLSNGAEANSSTPQQLQSLLKSEVVKWTKAAEVAGLSSKR